MKSLIVALLLAFTVTFGAVPRPAQQPDPLQPGAVPFCHKPSPDEDKPVANCTCTENADGIDLCKTDEPLPKFCKKMCGHARDCRCCSAHK